MGPPPIKPVLRGSTDTLLKASRANELIDRVQSLLSTKVEIGGAGASRFEVRPEHSVLSITKDDLLAALPVGAGQQIVASTGAPGPGDGSPGDVWIIYNPASPILAMFEHPMFFVGALTLNQVFGYLQAATALSITGAQVFAQTPPTGGDAIFSLVDGAGAALGATITLPAGQTVADASFSVSLAAGGAAQAKITQVGATTPGEFVTLVLRVARV